MKALQTITLGGKEYVILPKTEYVRLRKGAVPPGTVDAIAHAEASIGANLKRAREASGLTQEQLAERLGKSQAMVSGAESGRVRVSARYIAGVLEACGLPEDWPAHKDAAKKPQARPARHKAA
jgi:ribosome-binding protein aMBF1 (putative translation factor)